MLDAFFRDGGEGGGGGVILRSLNLQEQLAFIPQCHIRLIVTSLAGPMQKTSKSTV